MMDVKDPIVKLHNDLIGFDLNSPILVVKSEDGTLNFHQLAKSVSTSYLNYLYIHDDFKYGVLLPDDAQELLKRIKRLFDENNLDHKYCLLSPVRNGSVIYLSFPYLSKALPGPTIIAELKYVSTYNKFSIWLLRKLNREFNVLLTTLSKIYDANSKNRSRRRS